MAMTTSATNGLGMGLATAVVMAASSFLVALFRNHITQEVHPGLHPHRRCHGDPGRPRHECLDA
jgi:hypothetical protein